MDGTEFNVDVAKFNVYLLNEFVFESVPQMILVGINAYITSELDVVTQLSIALSAAIVANGLYRLVYRNKSSFFH